MSWSSRPATRAEQRLSCSTVERMSESPARASAPAPPAVAEDVFGENLATACRFVDLLCDSGVTHGLIGPREVPRIWERHVLNCAVVQELLPVAVDVIDVGSGAGLPGLALAIRRPDCTVHLVEPMLRRTTWLSDAVQQLGLTNVEVHRGRAEEWWDRLATPVVTARAVARLARLGAWSLPLLEPGGTLLALKGASATEELEQDRAELDRLGVVSAEVVQVGPAGLEQPTTVVRCRVGNRPAGRGGPGARRTAGSAPAAGSGRTSGSGRTAGSRGQRSTGRRRGGRAGCGRRSGGD